MSGIPASALPPLPDPPPSALLSAWLGLTRLIAPVGPRLVQKRLAKGKEDPARWREKLGEAGLSRPDGPLVWLHAVSVGESLSVLPLVQRLVSAGVAVLVTTTTVTSARLLADRLPAGAVHQYLPLDTAPAVARFLDHWRPDAAVFVESEFWPRLIHDAHARGIPLVLANARISDTSARRWRRFGGPIRAMLARFSAITVPEARMAQVLAGLGADRARITVAGSLKRGADRLPVDLRERAALAAAMGARPRWLAASTHPGEEEVVAAAQRLLLAGDPATLLVLAPRHPDRGAAVAALLAQAGLSVARRSAGEAITSATQVYLADTLGEMGLWFDLCPVAFVGGSLVAVGGHNAYEPVAHGAAVLTGPQVGNFADLYARLVAAGGARVVADAAGLAQAVAALGQPAARQAMADAARAAIAAEGDGTATTAAIILSALGRGAGAGAPSPA